MKSTFEAIFVLPRPLNCLITALAVYVGAFTAGVRWPSAPVLLAALSAALIAAAGYISNDLKDVDIDRINRPGRPLPAGRIGRRAATLEAWLCALAGLGLAWWLGALAGLAAGAIALGLVAYNLFLKRRAFWGNLLIAALSSAAFPYGALAAGSPGRSWIPAGFALLFHWGREIIKDMEDMEGDRARGARTLPLLWGRKRAILLASAVYSILIAFTLLPWLLDFYGMAYLLLVLGVDAALLWTVIQLHRGEAGRTPSSLNPLLKAAMFLGLLAIVAGEA